jgi:sec-independent protein translocase protein TatA
MDSMLAFLFNMPGWAEVLVIAFVGLLLFGKRLPEVARSLGKSVVEFKKGIRDLKDDVDASSSRDTHRLENQNRASLPPMTQQSTPSAISEPRAENKAAVESGE